MTDRPSPRPTDDHAPGRIPSDSVPAGPQRDPAYELALDIWRLLLAQQAAEMELSRERLARRLRESG